MTACGVLLFFAVLVSLLVTFFALVVLLSGTSR